MPSSCFLLTAVRSILQTRRASAPSTITTSSPAFQPDTTYVHDASPSTVGSDDIAVDTQMCDGWGPSGEKHALETRKHGRLVRI